MGQQYRPLRTLPEQEFNSIKDKLLATAPDGLSEKDFGIWIAPRLAAAVGEAEANPAPPEGSALGRFASGVGEMLNPVSLVKGVGSAIAHPIDTAMNIGAASLDQGRKAVASAKAGDVWSAAGHAGGMFPILGPAAANVGEKMAEGVQGGDLAGSMGQAAGLIAPMGAPSVIRAAGRAVRAVAPEGVRAATAGALERGAARRVADVMTPKVGANKTRFANIAEDVAPKIAADKDLAGGFSREALHGGVATKLDAATTALDAAADARLAARSFPTKPLIDALKEKIRALTSEAVEASDLERPSNLRTASRPLGKDVVPSPNAARVAVLQKAVQELEQLGPVTRYDPIRTMRMAYDGPAKAKYNPSVTQDFLKAQGGASGAADVTGVLRETMAKWDPQTAAANADYSLFKNTNDVLEAAAEVERARPTMFRKAMSRISGAAAGGGIGLFIAEVSEQVASAGWTTKLQTAKQMSKLASAIRRGDGGYVATLANQIKRGAAQAATVVGATSPSESRSQTTAPAR